ncbi:hypothetical protein [Kocuria rosea]|uniref:hypothetical protein n=1 Tax=Kocuria rosea TaxID=1275 RepID=UPI002B240EDE|nr:hypothetical protein [Kocuria rosea]MEB2620215.1 hypothetical protein [Kocuria rosea]
MTQTPFGQLQYYSAILNGLKLPVIKSSLVDCMFAVSTQAHEAWALFCEAHLGKLHGLPAPKFSAQEKMCVSQVWEILDRLPAKFRVFDFFVVRALMDACMSVQLHPSEIDAGVTNRLLSRVLGDRRSHPDWRLARISTWFQASDSAAMQLEVALEDAWDQASEHVRKINTTVDSFFENCFRLVDSRSNENFILVDKWVINRVYKIFAVFLEIPCQDVLDTSVLNRLGKSTVREHASLTVPPIVLADAPDLTSVLRTYDINYVKHFNVPTVAISDVKEQSSSDASDWFSNLLTFGEFNSFRWYCVMSFPAWHWFGFPVPESPQDPAGVGVEPTVHLITPVKLDVSTLADRLGKKFLGACVIETRDFEFFDYMVNMAMRTGCYGIYYPSHNMEQTYQSLISLRSLGTTQVISVLRTQHLDYLLLTLDETRVIIEVPTVLYGLLACFDRDLFDWCNSVLTKIPKLDHSVPWARLTALLAFWGAFPTDVKVDDDLPS